MDSGIFKNRVLDIFSFFWGDIFKKNKRSEDDDYNDDEYEDDDEMYEDDEYIDVDDEDEEGEGGGKRKSTKKEVRSKENLLLDMIDKGNMFEVRAFVAGIDLENVEICAMRDNLTVKIDVLDECDYENESYVYKELIYGTMERSIILTEEVDVDQVDAVVENGVLIVTLPKFNTARMKTVEVKQK